MLCQNQGKGVKTTYAARATPEVTQNVRSGTHRPIVNVVRTVKLRFFISLGAFADSAGRLARVLPSTLPVVLRLPPI
jgi:hypothetical protein